MISNIIDYQYLKSDNRHELICNMGIEVCPYCNRQYITSYKCKKKNMKRTTADLDHYLPKSIFNLLSLSLYNFIPTCQICNSRFKNSKRLKILYPYENGFEKNASFSVEINNKTNFDSLVGNNDFFDLKVKVNHKIKPKTKDQKDIREQIYNNIEMFNLDEVYVIHKQFVRELRYKQYINNTTYKKMLKTLMEDMNFTEEEMNLFQYGYTLNKEEVYKKPLSKLAYDILHE